MQADLVFFVLRSQISYGTFSRNILQTCMYRYYNMQTKKRNDMGEVTERYKKNHMLPSLFYVRNMKLHIHDTNCKV